jgi:hypothetical protein
VQLLQLKDEFLLSDEVKILSQTAFYPEKGKFVNKVTQPIFLPWLKKALTPKYSDAGFETWLKEKV